MNKDQVKGKIDNLKGRAKEAAGALTGDKKTQAEGAADRIKGAVQKKVGDVKHDVARSIEKDDDDQHAE
jgi:uncharacterized protein YjbJ (UPF0337 family)